MISNFFLNDVGVVCALGSGRAAVAARALAGQSGIDATSDFANGALIPLGVVRDALPSLEAYAVEVRSRNNQLALIAAAQIQDAVVRVVDRYGAHRVAIVVGTSTSGIGESENAIRAYVQTGALPPSFSLGQQELGSLSAFLAMYFGVTGPAYVHSSACASSAKAMASAARLIRNGLADAVITGGVDSLCGFTVAGFASLNLVSHHRCNPFSRNRDGINIGEGAALFLMTRDPSTVRLAGWGESSDGHHFSAPDPSGRGAAIAIEAALASAHVSARDVEYVNLHATGSKANDEMEGLVISTLLGNEIPTSGTKQLTGHTLGAAGALEAAICWFAMDDANRGGALPPHLWDGDADPLIPPIRKVAINESLGHPARVTLSTSFAFGGANAALVLCRE